MSRGFKRSTREKRPLKRGKIMMMMVIMMVVVMIMMMIIIIIRLMSSFSSISHSELKPRNKVIVTVSACILIHGILYTN